MQMNINHECGESTCGEDALMNACAIVAASEFNSQRFCELDAACAFGCVIAVDGGYAHLEHIGRAPDVAIGDFDSLGYVPQGVPVERFSANKDASDTELALMWAEGHGYGRIYAFGMLGGRLDHTIANMQVFARYSEEGMEILAEGASEELVFLSGPATLDIEARLMSERAGIQRASLTVSVFSMSDECTGVSERGMKWELHDVALSNRTSLGLSNELVRDVASVSVRSGTLAVFLPL